MLDGAIDVSTCRPRDLALQQAAGFQTALESYVQDCVDSTDSCFLGDSVDAGLARISDFLADDRDRAAAGGRVTAS